MSRDETFRAVLLRYARAKVRYWHMCFKIRLMRISLLAMGVVEGFFVRQYTVEATGQVPKKKRHPLLQVEDDEVNEVMNDYGNAIKQLAAANIFPGDMLLKDFGVTIPHQNQYSLKFSS